MLLLQRQFGIEPNADVALHIAGLNGVSTNSQNEVLADNFPQDGAEAEAGDLGFIAVCC